MDYDKLTNDELDALVATEIMGWAERDAWWGLAFDPTDCDPADLNPVNTLAVSVERWCPSRKWSDAHKAIDAMRRRGYHIQLSFGPADLGVHIRGLPMLKMPYYNPIAPVVNATVKGFDGGPRDVCIRLLKALALNVETDTLKLAGNREEKEK